MIDEAQPAARQFGRRGHKRMFYTRKVVTFCIVRVWMYRDPGVNYYAANDRN